MKKDNDSDDNDDDLFDEHLLNLYSLKSSFTYYREIMDLNDILL